MDKTGIYIDELRYVEDFDSGSGGQCEMRISMDEEERGESITVSTCSTNNDVQHDFNLKKNDWLLIRQAIDRHLESEGNE